MFGVYKYINIIVKAEQLHYEELIDIMYCFIHRRMDSVPDMLFEMAGLFVSFVAVGALVRSIVLHKVQVRL